MSRLLPRYCTICTQQSLVNLLLLRVKESQHHPDICGLWRSEISKSVNILVHVLRSSSVSNLSHGGRNFRARDVSMEISWWPTSKTNLTRKQSQFWTHMIQNMKLARCSIKNKHIWYKTWIQQDVQRRIRRLLSRFRKRSNIISSVAACLLLPMSRTPSPEGFAAPRPAPWPSFLSL